MLTELARMDLREPDWPELGCQVAAPKKNEPRYPTLWLSDRDEPLDLPDSGKAVVEYDVTRRTIEEVNGKKKHSYTIRIKSIDPETKPKKGGAVAGQLAAGGRVTELARTRSSDGTFAPEDAGGADAASFTKAYGPPASRPALRPGMVAAGAGAAAAGGALLHPGVRKRLKGLVSRGVQRVTGAYAQG